MLTKQGRTASWLHFLLWWPPINTHYEKYCLFTNVCTLYVCMHVYTMQGVFYCNFGRPLQCSSIALLCWLHQCCSERRSKENLREKMGIFIRSFKCWLFSTWKNFFSKLMERELASGDLLADLSEVVRQGGREGGEVGREGRELGKEGRREGCQPVRTPGRLFSLLSWVRHTFRFPLGIFFEEI